VYRIVETINDAGSVHQQRVRGSMGTMEHSKILGILEHRAHRFCPEIRLVLEHNALAQYMDETGTLRDFKAV
jgi:hypothetical protein